MFAFAVDALLLLFVAIVVFMIATATLAAAGFTSTAILLMAVPVALVASLWWGVIWLGPKSKVAKIHEVWWSFFFEAN